MNMDATTSTEAPRDTSYLTRPGGRIGYDVAGGGALVVLVPGMGDLQGGLSLPRPGPARGRATGSPALTCAAMVTATPRSRPTVMRKPPAISAR